MSELIRRFKVTLVGVDYGGGFDRNDALVRRFGIRRIAKYQYVNTNKKIYFEKELGRFMVNRTAVIMDVVNAINRSNVFKFPKWEQFEYPFGQDLVNMFSEYNESRRVVVLNKSPGTTDDTLHSLVYCFLASMINHPRPDILTPLGDGK